jgi:GTP-binding protein
MPDTPSPPLVAIIGKPNVGKSALFNRLIGRRKAIVAEEPGVTRDINYESISLHGHRCRLADSAGFIRTKNDLDRITRVLNMRLIEEASLLLFTCEVGSMDSADFELAETVRRSGTPCILAVNKVDNERLEEQVYEFFELGFGAPVAVSASHGRNIKQLTGRIVELLPALEFPGQQDSEKNSGGQYREENPITVAIVGKPNVGKSSLLNVLTREERAIVLPDPGTTRDALDEIVEFQGHTLRFIDTAGLRKQRKVRQSVEYYSTLRSERAIREATVSVLMIDATEGISSQDKKIAWTITEARRGLVIAANKWDLMNLQNRKESDFVEEIHYRFPHAAFAEVIPISAKDGYNIRRLLKNIVKVYNNYYSTIQTSDLNSFISRLQPGASEIKYGYQRGSAPPRFEFFVRNTDTDDTGFKRYLANSLRKGFDLSGVPLEISLRKR